MAEIDKPLEIGHGQTNSQPFTVRKMLEWLDVQPGDNVLDVGSGSGWTTALLSHLTGNKGCVTAVEIIPELMVFGRENCLRQGVKNVQFHLPDNSFGWPANAPYDRILVSAAANAMPETLESQLAVGGRAVVPVRSSIWVIDKAGVELSAAEYPGFAFVPLR